MPVTTTAGSHVPSPQTNNVTMFSWVKKLFRLDPEAVRARNRRKKQRLAGKRVRDRERQLRRGVQGKALNAEFYFAIPGTEGWRR